MVVIGGLFGLLAGTVIAVLLDRLFTGAPLGGPVLVCRDCRAIQPPVAWSGLLGFLLLHGRCRACGERLPARLLYLPLLGAAAFAFAFLRLSGVQLALASLFIPLLLALTAADFERRLLPNRIMYPAILLALALSWAWPGRDAQETILGGMVGFGVMFLIFHVMPGFGFGDVKLAALLGLVAGIGNLMPALLFAAIAAGVVAAALLITRRASRTSVIAYGPYLALGAYAAMLAR